MHRIMDKFHKHLAGAGVFVNDFKSETYLDYAEKIVKSLMDMGIQQRDGCIRDPFEATGITYRGKKLELFYYHAEARFCGSVGQLLRAGRALEYADELYLSYRHLLDILTYDFEPGLYAEFWIKELVFAYLGLKAVNYPGADEDIWEKITWRRYGFHYNHVYNNFVAYAIASEACKINAGLGGDRNFFDAWVPVLFDKFNKDSGMYVDTGAPMAYDMITRQQLLYALMNGADGEYRNEAEELCKKGAASSLFMQSVTGQMPFGGRTNQYLCVEAILSCFFEDMCRLYAKSGDDKAAGLFKRAAGNAAASTGPWLDMVPFRHIRQGFEPSLGHGVDSGGVYTVYGLLCSSIFGTAYHEAMETNGIPVTETPAEKGGNIFVTSDDFHKVTATCGDYHIEVDTCADPEKDATGLGRLHKRGFFPETALSGPCAPEPTYSYAVYDIDPRACAIGPSWTGENGEYISLADFGCDEIKSRINVMKESEDGVVFSIIYNISDIKVEETYQLTEKGLLYNVKGDLPGLHITVPVIKTDGMAEGRVSVNEDGVVVTYRGGEYTVTCDEPHLTGESCVNRNGIYDIVRTGGHTAKLQINTA